MSRRKYIKKNTEIKHNILTKGESITTLKQELVCRKIEFLPSLQQHIHVR